MKKFWNRAVSWLLAATMTLSLVPTGALAARWDEETPETPAVDGMQVVDAQKKDDGEKPEIPVGPDDPVTPEWDDLTIDAEINADGTWTVNVSGPHPNQDTGTWMLVLVPNVTDVSGGLMPHDLIDSGDIHDESSNGNTVETLLSEGTGIAAEYITAIGPGVQISFDNSGKCVISSDEYGEELPNYNTLVEKLTGYYGADGNEASFTNGVPFLVIFTSSNTRTGLMTAEATMAPPQELVIDDITIMYDTIGSIWKLQNADGTWTDMIDEWGSGTAYVTATNTHLTDDAVIMVDDSGFFQDGAISVDGTLVTVGFADNSIVMPGAYGGTIPAGESDTWEIYLGSPAAMAVGTDGTVTVSFYYGTELKTTKFKITMIVTGGWEAEDISLTAPEGYDDSYKYKASGRFTWTGEESTYLNGGSFATAVDGAYLPPIEDASDDHWDPDTSFKIYLEDGTEFDQDVECEITKGQKIRVEYTPVSGLLANRDGDDNVVPYKNQLCFLDANGQPAVFMLSFTVMPNDSFTVTYDETGGTWATGSASKKTQSGTPGTNLDVPTAADVSKPGYKFKGWFTAATDGTAVTATTIGAENVTYYAQWTENTGRVTVKLDNSNSTTPGSPKLTSASEADRNPEATSSGGVYNFGTLTAGVTYNIIIGGEKVGTLTTTVEGGPATATIPYWSYHFYENKGTATGTVSGMPSDVAYIHEGNTIKYPTPPSLPGYKFGGWHIGTADGTLWTSGDRAINSGSRLFYADWTANTVTVRARKDNDSTPYQNSGTVEVKLELTTDASKTYTGTLDTSGNCTVSGVPNGTYKVKIGGVQAKKSDGTDLNDVTVNDNSPAAVTAWWYTATAVTGGNGTVKVEAVGGDPASDTTDSTANSSKEIVVPAGTDVTWTATSVNGNYNFTGWTEESGTAQTTTPLTLSVAAPTTRTGNFGQGEFTVTVKVTWDGDTADVVSKTASVAVNSSTQTINSTNTTRSFTLPKTDAGYPLTVDGHATGITLKPGDDGKTVEVKYVSAIVKTDGYGAATATGADGNNITFGTALATAGSTTATLWVFPGTEVTWTRGDPIGDYQFKEWQENNAKTDTTKATVNSTTTRTATFEKEKADITVKFQLNGADWTAAPDTAVVIGTAATTPYGGMTGTTSNGTVMFSNVEWNTGTKYTVYVGGVDATAAVTGGTTDGKVEVTGDQTITVNFYQVTAKVKEDGKGTATVSVANGVLAMQVGGAALSSAGITSENATDGTGKSLIVLGGSTATWAKSETTTNYKFKYWDAVGTTADPSETNIGATTTKTHTAVFGKEQYNTYLYLTVNGTQWGDLHSIATEVTDTAKIKSVELVTANNGNSSAGATVSNLGGTDKIWAATGVPKSVTTPYWKITTADGGVYYAQASTADSGADVAPVLGATEADDKALVRKALYGVTVEDGESGNATSGTLNRATLAGVKRVVIPVGTEGAKAIAANPKDGFSLKQWNAGNATDPGAILGAQGSISGGNFQLAAGYTSTTDLFLKPVYTYEVTVKTVKSDGTTAQPVSSIVLKDTTATGAEADKSSTTDVSSYKFTGLTVDRTYDIYINGFKVGDTSINNVSNGKAGKTVTVKVFSVSVQKRNEKDNTAVSEGTAYVSLGTTTPAAATPVYLPIGATTTAGASDKTKVNLAAAAGTNFRLYNIDDTSAANADEVLWNVAFTAPGGKTMTATVSSTAANNAQTPGNLMVGGADGMQADVTVTAYFVRQYSLTASAVKSDKTTPASTSKVNVTEKQGLGTSDLPSDEAQSVSMTKVDEKSYVKVEFIKGTGETLTGWYFTDADGELYTDLKADGTVDPAKKLDAAAAANAKTADIVYFVPAKNNAALKAVVEDDKYTVKVKVYLNNAVDGTFEVELRNGGTQNKTTYKIGSGYYESNDKLGFGTDYAVWTNVTGQWENTGRVINFKAEDGEAANGVADAGGDASKVETTLYYYSVTVQKATTDSGTLPDTFTATHNPGTDFKVVLAKSGGTVDVPITATGNNSSAASGPYYKFKDWAATDTTKTALPGLSTPNNGFKLAVTTTGNTFQMPSEETLKVNTNIKKDNGIILTATYQRQYKVTVDLAPGTVKTTLGSSTNPKVAATTAPSSWEDPGNTSVLVDKDGVAQVGYSGGLTNWYFKEWRRAADTGTFNGPTATTGNQKGTKKSGGGTNEYSTVYNAPNSFTPTADSTLYADFWQDGQLAAANWTYTQGNASASDNNASNQNQLGWTANDAQTPTITVKGRATGSPTYTLTTSDYDTSTTGGKTTYTLKPAFLNGLAPDMIYDVTFSYTLGTTGTTGANTYNLTKSTLFDVKLKTYTLDKVDIRVESNNATANPNETNRDSMEYDGHTDLNIATTDLEWTWYYASADPGQKPVADSYAVPSTWKKVTTNDEWKDTSTCPVTPAMEGMYVFALVRAKEGSNGTGKVITNAKLVDYNAEITVKKDGSNVAADNYKVFLVPSGPSVAQSDFANDTALAAKGIAKANTFASGVYKTTGAPLNANTNYVVYVSDAESSTYYIQATEAGTVTRTSNTGKEVNYYSVNRKDFAPKHFVANSGGNLGETFPADKPIGIASVTTGNGSDVPNGNGVHVNSTVRALANGSNWTQDYHLDWQAKEVATGDYTFAQDTDMVKQNQTKADAIDTTSTNTNRGYARTVSARTFIGGQLEQNTYIIRGNVANPAGSTSTGGTITSPKLTVNGRTINGTFSTGSGAVGSIVSFTVPKTVATAALGAATPNYVVSATEGTSTTIRGYSVPSGTTIPNPSKQNITVADGTPGEIRTGQFTIFVETTLKSLTVKDGHTTPDAHQATATGVYDTGAPAKHTNSGVFENYNADQQSVTITNDGNTPLEVKLIIKEGTTDIYTGTQDSSGTLTHDGATITGLDQLTGGKVTLAKGESKTFTIETKTGLDVGTEKYSFVFSSTDARTGTAFAGQKGPGVTYEYNIEITKAHVDSVTTKYDPGTDTYTMDTTVIEEDIPPITTPADTHTYTALNKDTLVAPADTAKPKDLVYKWYYADWDARVVLNSNNEPVLEGTSTKIPEVTASGISDNGLSFTPTDDERGKALYLVVVGQNNAQDAAMTPDRTKGQTPLIVPYGAEIIIEEGNGKARPQNAADAANYTVYLWRTGTGTFNKSAAITTTWDNDSKSFKTSDTALWPCDKDNPTTTAWTYEVYASVVKGSDEVTKVGNITIQESNREATVNYYTLTLDETTYTNGIYEDKLTDTNKFFTSEAPRKTGITPTGNVVVNGKDVPAGKTGNVNSLVRSGTVVDITEPKWDFDYTLSWVENATRTGTDDPATGATATTAALTKDTKVTSKLTLNLYEITAYVVGGGVVSEITMTEGTTVFSVNGTAGSIQATDKTGSIAGGNQAKFTVPEGTYTLDATRATSSTTVNGYQVPHDGDGATSIKVDHADADTRSFDVLITGEGQQMQVADDHSNPHSATASYSGGAYHGMNGHTYTVDYHNYTDFTHKITVTNTSTELVAGEGGQHIYNVTRVDDTSNAGDGTHNITLDAFEVPTGTIADMAGSDSREMEFHIPAGLAAGTYTYSAEFGFYPEATDTDDDNRATATFTLTVEVKKQPFKAVTIAPDTDPAAADGTYKMTEYTVDVQDGAGNYLKNDGGTGLTQAHDYSYQWVTFPIGTTPDVELKSDGTLDVKNGDKVGTDSGSYTTLPADQGKELRLVIYAKNSGNASDLAISDAFTNDYEGIVYIANGTSVLNGTEPSPKYRVEFRATGEQTKVGEWNEVSGTTNIHAYTAPLKPGKDYDVYVSRFAGDTSSGDLVKIATLNDDNIGTAYPGDPKNTNVTMAEYFNVYSKALAEKHYTDGTKETIAATSKAAPALTLGGAPLSSGTPVLKDQSVTATAADHSLYDYALIWQSDNATTTVSHPTDDTANQTTTGDTYTQNIKDTTYIGGRLKQNTYTVTGRIVNPDGKSGGVVTKVTLAHQTDTTNTNTFTFTASSDTGDHKFNDGAIGTGDGTLGNSGDTVTFTVVRGKYDIVAYEGAKTAIREVTVGGFGDTELATKTNTSTTWADRNKEVLTPQVTKQGRIFTIELEALYLGLTVKDDHANLTDYTDPANTGDHSATSTIAATTDDNKQTVHPVVYYFNSVDTATIPLYLENKSNTQLTVSGAATKVKTMPTATDFANGTNLGTAVVAADKVTITGLPDSVDMAIDQKDLAAGTVTAKADAANSDDYIYIVRFTSTTTNTNEDPVEPCPTVYYVFDLTIDPLPIVQVDAEQDGTTSQMRLIGSDTGTGLDHVWVEPDDSGTTGTAKDNGIVDGDVNYVWYYSDSATLTTDDFEISGNTVVPKVAGSASVKGTGKTCTPDPEEQGKFFYLIAFRNPDGSNASDFAVSDAVYARVTISLKAYQTGKSGPTDPTLDDVQIWVTEKPSVTSNNGTIVVTGNDDTSIGFTADMNAYLHGKPAGKPDDSSQAVYYFHHWAVKPLSLDGETIDEIDETDTSVTTPVDSDRLQMSYAVTEQATVIGYYDKLPVLTAPLGYDKTTNKDVADNRSFHYVPYDGSGKLAKIVITGNIDGTTVTHELNSLAFAGTGFSYPAAGFGAEGDYVIPEAWIKETAVLAEGSYIVTFYDADEGILNEGYAGYDRWAEWNITEGEKRVKAQVKDSSAEGAEEAVYWGEVTISNGKDTQAGTTGLTVETVGNKVNLTATPNSGYKFKEWRVVEDSGKGDFSDDTATPVFTARSGEVTVEASFEAAEFSANTDATAAVYYGDDEWDGDAAEITISGDPDAVQDFHLELPDYTKTVEADALKKFLTDSGKTEAEAAAIVAKAAKAPDWLKLTEKTVDGKVTGATFSVVGSATGVHVVKDATDEVVAYVKITEQNATNSGTPNIQYVPYTVDVKTAELQIVTAGTQAHDRDSEEQKVLDGDAYRALYKAATDATYPGEGKDIENGAKVLFEYFNYINVQNTRNATDFADGDDTGNGHAAYAAGEDRTDPETYGYVTNGYWTVEPVSFDGVTGGNEYVEGADNTNDNDYKFTYHYTGEAADKSDALDYEKTATIILKIPVLVPSLSLKFSDLMQPTDAIKPFDVRPATVDRDTEKGWGPYSSYNDVEANLTESGAPLALNLASDAWRNGEHITYLDNEPYYEVTLQKIGTMYNATLTEDTANTKGFEVDGELPDISTATGDITFRVKLTALNADGLWAGEHTISFTAKGNPRADGTGTDVVATYTLTVYIDPKVITELDVKLDEPVSGGKPDTTPTVTGKDGEDLLVEDDGKGNTPVKPEVKWYQPDGETPMEPTDTFGEDNYPVKVVVTVDPNYIYASDDPDTEDVDEDIVPNTALNDSKDGDDGTEVTRNDEHTVVTITKPMKSPITIGAIFDGFKREDAGKPVEEYKPESKNDERYPIANEATYGEDWFWATSEDPDTPLPGDTLLEGGKTYVLTVKLDPNEDYAFVPFVEDNNDLATFNTVKLTDVPSLAGLDAGVLDVDENGNYTLRYHFTVPNPSSPPPPPSCPYQVFYYLGLHGTTDDSTIEAVSVGGKPAKVPEVTAIEGYTFLGWSLTRPEEGKEVQLIDPTTERITEDTTFYAVYEQNGPVVKRHTNYIVGFPNGTFGPEKDITRAQVATIIARAILPGFKERSDYGNIGGYSDVEGHWAASAIAYCSKYGVFKGYDDGTFQPNRSITRQELALVVARLDGISEAGDLPFRDSEEVSSWALDGIFTAYDRGLIKGYDDGTFRPQSNIRRDEAVTIFNRYLKRGVDAKGLEGLTPYLYGETVGEAGSQYMVWPDVPETLWSYYEVIEASNDHEFYYVNQKDEVPPEHWTSCWIDGTWDDGSAAKLNVTATSLAITAKTSVPFVGTEAPAAYVTAPTAWVGMIRTPLWVSKELEVQF